mmetsp:Transcript_11383/g.32327  ORF Transcript_11383/g.32327 Transcript_11383/m.32327 type:complete len:240 (+) Transcript_11383:625-1344(+)
MSQGQPMSCRAHSEASSWPYLAAVAPASHPSHCQPVISQPPQDGHVAPPRKLAVQDFAVGRSIVTMESFLKANVDGHAGNAFQAPVEVADVLHHVQAAGKGGRKPNGGVPQDSPLKLVGGSPLHQRRRGSCCISRREFLVGGELLLAGPLEGFFSGAGPLHVDGAQALLGLHSSNCTPQLVGHMLDDATPALGNLLRNEQNLAGRSLKAGSQRPWGPSALSLSGCSSTRVMLEGRVSPM